MDGLVYVREGMDTNGDLGSLKEVQGGNTFVFEAYQTRLPDGRNGDERVVSLAKWRKEAVLSHLVGPLTQAAGSLFVMSRQNNYLFLLRNLLAFFQK